MQLLNKQQLSLAILIALLSTTVLVALDNGKNDIHKYLLQEHLDYWVKDEAGRNNEWKKANQYFEQAKSSYITDPDTFAYGARLHEWATVLNNNKSTQINSYLNQTIDMYIKSIQVRPLWPYAWKDLTTALEKENNYGHEFQESFKNTILLGRQEDRIQVEMSDIGLRKWRQLSVANRKLFIPFLRNTARKHAVELTRFKYNKMSRLILCNGVKDNSVIKRYCDK